MNKFNQRIYAFMQGRYGLDGFGRFLFILSLVVMFIGALFSPLRLLYFAGFVILIYAWYRVMSKNVSKRYQENVRFNGLIEKYRKDSNQRKLYKIFKCPNCTQKIRVPKGKGKICIKCPKCRIEFIKKT